VFAGKKIDMDTLKIHAQKFQASHHFAAVNRYWIGV